MLSSRCSSLVSGSAGLVPAVPLACGRVQDPPVKNHASHEGVGSAL